MLSQSKPEGHTFVLLASLLNIDQNILWERHHIARAISNVVRGVLAKLAMASIAPALHVAIAEERTTEPTARRDGNDTRPMRVAKDGLQRWHVIVLIADIVSATGTKAAVRAVAPALVAPIVELRTRVSAARKDGLRRLTSAEVHRAEQRHVAICAARAVRRVVAETPVVASAPAPERAVVHDRASCAHRHETSRK